jgi:hypothetical protein
MRLSIALPNREEGEPAPHFIQSLKTAARPGVAIGLNAEKER